MAAKFQFDDAKLAVLKHDVPSNLQILRLRLRFGLPQQLTIGQRFRISLELVDEMGQSATISQELLRHLTIQISHETGSSLSPGVELKTNQLATNTSKSSSCTWNFDAEFSLKLRESNQSHEEEHDADQLDQSPSSIDAAILLQIHSKRAFAGDRTEFHRAFQQFCLHSTWIDAETLVLPLQSPTICLLLPSSSAADSETQVRKSNTNLGTSTLCSRVFSISGPLTHSKAQPESPATVITIQENYGDTMGSHIWDASILLSFAVYTASQSPSKPEQEQRGPHVMLELGAGCGLFAAVYSTLFGDRISRPSTETPDTVTSMVLTERAESLELLKSNLRLNNQRVDDADRTGKAPKHIQFLPLVWGRTPINAKEDDDIPRVDTVFAADVLYNWSAHEPLLRTLDEIVHHHRRSGGSGLGDAVSVVIAHKHRGKAATSSIILEKLLHGGDCTIEACHEPNSSAATTTKDGSCQWTNWRVTRAARLGKVDLLLLVRTPGSQPLSQASSVDCQ